MNEGKTPSQEKEGMRKMEKVFIDKINWDRVEELEPIHDTRKSFYGKAKILTVDFEADNGHHMQVKKLYSYNTLVVTFIEDITEGTGVHYSLNLEEVEEHLLFSNTTLRHIKEAILQVMSLTDEQFYKLNLKGLTKKNILKYNEQ